MSRVASTTNVNYKQYESQDGFSCPRCKSSRVVIGYPDIKCGACGWSEPLIDFPISWDWHRHYRVEYGLPDPGPCEPVENQELKAINKRLESIEEKLTGLTPEDLKQFKLKHIYDEVKNIRRGLQYTQKLLADSIKPKAAWGKSKGVKL